MKKAIRTILCITLACSVCLLSSAAVFASESAGESEINLDDLLNLLSSFGDESEGNEAVDEAFADYTMNDISFSFPADWTSEEDEDTDSMEFYSPDYMAFANVMLEDVSEEDSIDIRDEENLALLRESMGGDDVSPTMDYVTVCGYDALWVQASMEEEISVNSYSLILPYDETVFVLTMTSMSDDMLALFASVVSSVSIDGADGITDISAVFDPDSIPVSAGTDSSVKDKPAAAPSVASAQEEYILHDDEDCTVILKDISFEESYYAMHAVVYVENKTDLNLYFSFDGVSINGYMLDPYWGVKVEPGNNTNSDLRYYIDDFEDNDIEIVRDMEFTLKVTNDDDWFADPILEESFIIYPNGEDVPEQKPQEFDDDAIVLLENDDYTMILKDFDDEDTFYFSAELYLENRSDQAVDFAITGATAVNGVQMNPYFSRTVQPGKKMNASVHWYNDDLTANGIEKVEDLELEIHIEDPEDWFADPICSAVVDVHVD